MAALQSKRAAYSPPSLAADMIGWNWIATDDLGCEGYGRAS